MAGDEKTVDVIDRERMQQHVTAGEAPLLDQRERVAAQIAMGEHGALGTAGRAGGIEDRRKISRTRVHRIEYLGLVGGLVFSRGNGGQQPHGTV